MIKLYETMVSSVVENVEKEIEELDIVEITDHFSNGTNNNEVFKKFYAALRSGKIK